MTIRANQITFADPANPEFMPISGWTPPLQDILSLVRHVMRDRSDCDQIPVVLDATQTTIPDQYGSNIFIHVEYAKRGYQAVYGALLTDSGISKFQCYMD